MLGDLRLSALRASEGWLIDAVLLLGYAIGTGWLICIAADFTLPARNTCLFAGVAVCLFSIFPRSLSSLCRLGFQRFTLSSAGRRRNSFRSRRHQTDT